MKIKAKTFSKYGLIDKKDFYKRVLAHLEKTNQSFCFLPTGEMITREDCQNFNN